MKYKKLKKIKNKKHQDIVNDFDNIKQSHLEKLASKSLENQEIFSILKDKKIDKNILDLF